jgi:pyruvate kinase
MGWFSRGHCVCLGGSFKCPGSRQIPLNRGEMLLLTTNPIYADSSSKQNGVYVSYSLLPQHVRPGSRIFVDDGNVELEVVSVDADKHAVMVKSYVCRVCVCV